MTETKQQQIEKLIQEGYQFPTSTFIRDGWALCKQHIGAFIGFIIVTFAIGMTLGMIPILGIIGSFANNLFIAPALWGGFYLVCRKVEHGQYKSFEDFFSGFSFIRKLGLMTLIQTMIVLAIMTPFIIQFLNSGLLEWYMEILSDPTNIGALEDPDFSGLNVTNLGITFLAIFPLLVYFSIAYSWAPLFIVFYGASSWEALEYSRRLITKQWFSIFGLHLAFLGIILLLYIPIFIGGIIMGIAGASAWSIALFALLILTFLGALIVFAPFAACAVYRAFAQVTGLHDDKNTQEDILQHLVD